MMANRHIGLEAMKAGITGVTCPACDGVKPTVECYMLCGPCSAEWFSAFFDDMRGSRRRLWGPC